MNNLGQQIIAKFHLSEILLIDFLSKNELKSLLKRVLYFELKRPVEDSFLKIITEEQSKIL